MNRHNESKGACKHSFSCFYCRFVECVRLYSFDQETDGVTNHHEWL